MIQTKENYFYQKPLFETGQEEDLETLMKEAEEEPYFYAKPLFETKRERLENVMAMVEDRFSNHNDRFTDTYTDPMYSYLPWNIWNDDDNSSRYDD